jgi:hypothetical protein
MDNDSSCFDHGVPTSSSAGFAGVDLQPALASDFFADIGYESADPSLQSPLWCAVTQALLAKPDAR